MRRQESGFTLIELVIVLVILGILAAVAVPQFYDATTDAETAAISAGKSAVATAIAVQTARGKAAPIGNSVKVELPGSTCSGVGFLQIPGGSGGKVVRIQLLNTAGTAAADCTAALIGGVSSTGNSYTL